MTISRDHGLISEELRMLEGILAKLSGQGADLPFPLFRSVTEITATANVDLLVQAARSDGKRAGCFVHDPHTLSSDLEVRSPTSLFDRSDQV